MDSYPCSTCKLRLLMPDGSYWCSLTMKPIEQEAIKGCLGYEFGTWTVYKIVPINVPKRITKTVTKEIKPKPVVIKPVKSSKKTIPSQQQKLF